MNKKYSIFFDFIFILILFVKYTYSFDRITTEKYLADWAYKRNSAYTPQFLDCANFGSQCLIAGNIILKPGQGAPNNTFPLANDLKTYLESNLSINTDDKSASDNITYRSNIKMGDIIFWTYGTGWARHTLVVQENTGSDILYGCHTSDNLNASLQTNWEKNILRYIYLPDAPIIKYIEVTQKQGGNDVIVYKWNYDGDETQNKYKPVAPSSPSDEYYKHTYDGLKPVIEEERITNFNNEKLKFKIIFDQQMKRSDMKVSFGKTDPYNFKTATFVSWESLLHSDDSLKVESDIPMDINIAESKNYININVYSKDGGPGVDGTQIDEDGVLDEYNPGENKKHRILLPTLEIKETEKVSGSSGDIYVVFGDVDLQVKGLDDYKAYDGTTDLDIYVKFEDSSGNLIKNKLNPSLDKVEDAPYKILFNTKQKSGAAANINAAHNGEAQYPDGTKIKLQAKVYQHKGTTDFYMGKPTTKAIGKGVSTPEFPFDNNLKEAGLSKELVIDNYRPSII